MVQQCNSPWYVAQSCFISWHIKYYYKWGNYHCVDTYWRTMTAIKLSFHERFNVFRGSSHHQIMNYRGILERFDIKHFIFIKKLRFCDCQAPFNKEGKLIQKLILHNVSSINPPPLILIYSCKQKKLSHKLELFMKSTTGIYYRYKM